MKLSNSVKIKLKLVLSITFAWLLVSSIIELHDNLFYNQIKITGLNSYRAHYSFVTNALAVFIAGFVAVPFMVFYLKDRFRGKPGWLIVLIHTFIFLALIVIVTIPVSLFYFSILEQIPLEDPYLVERLMLFYTGPGFLMYLLSWTLISTITMVIMQVNDKYGQGVLFNLMKGKYNQPQEETRIFMFLDMSDSTTIAELLGNIKYFNLLQNFFEELTAPIIKRYGEIYQYVGDEIVVSWTMKNGIRHANCIECFFKIKEVIESKADYFNKKFGLVPGFKAGIHCGEVTVGEIGTIKKDIIFSGDVLNTTSRIQEACHRFDADLLISKDLLDCLKQDNSYVFNEIGAIHLKGKLNPVDIYRVDKLENTDASIRIEDKVSAKSLLNK